ncbi:MAG: DUF1501 domain-containing protein [Lysobacterales bacterium]
MNHPKYSRRDFVRGGACMVAAGAASSFLPKLNLMGEALAQSGTGTGYKALVCVYLGGGNDSWNLLIPTGTNASGQFSHAEYVAARNGLYSGTNTGGLAVPRVTTSGALPPALALNNTSGNLGVNPFAPELAALYNSNRLSFIANVGTVSDPITRATFNNRKKPPQLFSHNDQTSLWQIGSGNNLQITQGFGGQIAGVTAQNNLVGLSSAISIAGQTRFLVGETLSGAPVFPFQMSTSTTTPAPLLNNYNAGSSTQGEPQRRGALNQLFNLAYPELYSLEYRDIFNRSLQMAAVVNAEMAANGTINTTFPANNSLADQLRQVARMIKISRPASVGGPGAIAANRQVYYVNLGGFDTHDSQITSTSQAQGHHLLLQRLSQAVNAFNSAMVEIGAANEVTLFTMSDFARTLNSNGNGTDHAWGSVQFVMGGGVSGGQVKGRYPRIVLDLQGDNNGESFSRGQFLPTTASDQLAATLARWMGVDDANLPAIFPNIDNFASGPFANAAATPTFAHFNRVIPGLLAGVS